MAKQRPHVSCFISYCHENVDRAAVDYIIHTLRDSLGSTAELLFDQQLKYGSDFRVFMQLLDRVHAVLLLLTPSYKHRILARQGGVYEEYKRIMERYDDGVSAETDGPSHAFEIIPILLSGTPEQSVPEELATLKHLSLTNLHVTRKQTGEFVVPQKILAAASDALTSLSLQIKGIATVESEAFRNLSDSYYDRLFVDLKAKFDDPTFVSHAYLDTILVKTHSYKRIDNQVAFWVVGRKGSGKSTLAQVLPLINGSRYQGVLTFTVDDLNLELLYSQYGEQQFRSDVNRAVSQYKAFKFTWEAVLMLGAMKALAAQARDLSSVQLRLLEPIHQYIGRIPVNNVPEAITALFLFAFSATVNFVRDCIDGATSDPSLFLIDIDQRFTLDRYLHQVFGPEVLNAFRQLLQTLDKKFLVTLDGFDSVFESFRYEGARQSEPDALTRRVDFEVDWLRALLSFTIHAKNQQQHYFYNLLDFCVTVPKDRFMEARRTERDSYRFWRRWATLNWSGIELAILLRKRLEVLAQHRTREEASPKERLAEILRNKAFKGLPQEIQFDYNGKDYAVPLYLYVLRHTFWRPREILMYYAALLALAEDMRRWGYEVSIDAVRNCVKAQAVHVIESEFIGEFQNMVNVEEIIHAFRRSPGLVTYDDLQRIVGPIEFRLAGAAAGDRLPLLEKVKFLYDIGFLGLRADRELARELGLNIEDAFCFNEGSSFMHRLTDEEANAWTFVIHPVFSEYLRLDRRGQDLCLRLTWDYLHVQEAFLAANPQM